ncbi:uncharacterized protein LOC108091906 [Drosophila ficusphila]|uniref:uncharacterized protein LOC108091906 n=1 Tax=Drosophila ficusphila TaxID=30025 RepID=UPI0007E740A7|nr:uncharacterized protein LOC108091906 [Drosophila ficusphila]XP_043065010.1 uncharacterized protein LOC108091906 [Drosophila ficusphila]
MPLIYYDRTINSAQELILAGLRDATTGTSLRDLTTFVTRKTGFPGEVCFRVIVDALEEGMACKTIREKDGLFYDLPPKPRRLPARRKCKIPQAEPANDCCDN